MNFETGDKLILRNQIFDENGVIVFEKGDVVIIRDVVKKEAFVGKSSGQYYPEEIIGIKLVDHYGIWSLKSFDKP